MGAQIANLEFFTIESKEIVEASIAKSLGFPSLTNIQTITYSSAKEKKFRRGEKIGAAISKRILFCYL
jgi:hypothetical protein